MTYSTHDDRYGPGNDFRYIERTAVPTWPAWFIAGVLVASVLMIVIITLEFGQPIRNTTTADIAVERQNGAGGGTGTFTQ